MDNKSTSLESLPSAPSYHSPKKEQSNDPTAMGASRRKMGTSSKGSTKNAIWATVHEYADTSTTHGINYVFNTSLLGLERFVWLLVCIAFYVLAVYWIKGVYDQWQNSPVITSVHTTGKL